VVVEERYGPVTKLQSAERGGKTKGRREEQVEDEDTRMTSHSGEVHRSSSKKQGKPLDLAKKRRENEKPLKRTQKKSACG